MPRSRTCKNSAHVSVLHTRKVKNAPTSNEITTVGIMFNVADGIVSWSRSTTCLGRSHGCKIPMRVVEMISGISEGVYFELLEKVLWD